MANQTTTFATNPEFAARFAELMAAFPEEAKHLITTGFTTTTEPVAPAEKKRTKKAARDPNLPKRPKNAFMLFTDSVREGIKERLIKEAPDGKIRVADISKHCGECWKNLSDDEKQPFIDANTEAKVKYEQEMTEYYEKYPDKKPVTKQPKAPKEPKEPKTKTGFQIDTDAEAAFDANLPEGWARSVAGYLGGAVKDPETGKAMKFKTFEEAVAAANTCDCGGITRTKTAYTLRKSSTVKESSAAEFSWTRTKSENGMSSSESDADN